MTEYTQKIYDANGTVVTTVHADHHNLEYGRFVLSSEVVCDDIIKEARLRHEQRDRKSDLHFVGSIPVNIYYQAVLETAHLEDRDALANWIARYLKENPAFTGKW
jgi:hypothetical protein